VRSPLESLAVLGEHGGVQTLLLTLYNTLIRSRIEYGDFLTSLCKENLFYKLEKIQLKCLRLAMGYRTSIPVNIIISESKTSLIKYRLKLLCYKFLLICLRELVNTKMFGRN